MTAGTNAESDAQRKSGAVPHGRGRGRPFAPGNPGRVPGVRNRATIAVAELLEGEAEALTRKCVALGKAGDTTALRLCLERLLPPRKDVAIHITLPPVNSAMDAVRAGSAVLADLAAGNITPGEAAAVMGILQAHRGLIETGELEARITQLEGNGGKS